MFSLNLCSIWTPAEALMRSWCTPEVSWLPHLQSFVSAIYFLKSHPEAPWPFRVCVWFPAAGCPFTSEKETERDSPFTLGANYLDIPINTDSALVSWEKKYELGITFPQTYFILSSASLSSVPTGLSLDVSTVKQGISHVLTVRRTH